MDDYPVVTNINGYNFLLVIRELYASIGSLKLALSCLTSKCKKEIEGWDNRAFCRTENDIYRNYFDGYDTLLVLQFLKTGRPGTHDSTPNGQPQQTKKTMSIFKFRRQFLNKPNGNPSVSDKKAYGQFLKTGKFVQTTNGGESEPPQEFLDVYEMNLAGIAEFINTQAFLLVEDLTDFEAAIGLCYMFIFFSLKILFI